MSRNKVLILVIILTVFIIVFTILVNSSSKYKKLSVSETKWKSIQEARTENKNLELEEIKFNDYKLIIDKTNNTLYYSLVNDSICKYNPNVSYSSNSKNTKLAILFDEITDEKVKNNYIFKIMIYNEKEFNIYYLKCTDIPILNISYNKDDVAIQKNIPMEMYLFDNLSTIPNKITISSGKIRFNNNNYVFSLHMLTPGKNKRENKLSILNMKPDSEYVLNPIDQQSENGIKNNQIVELFFNNEYKGIYSIGHIEKNNENMPKQNIKERLNLK